MRRSPVVVLGFGIWGLGLDNWDVSSVTQSDGQEEEEEEVMGITELH